MYTNFTFISLIAFD